MIYSQSFDNLNPAAKTKLWRALYDLLSQKGTDAAAAAIAIVAATRPDHPAYWKTPAKS
jgi:hypothetical protein